MRNKKWARHIINRFGVVDAFGYTKTRFRCPCILFNKRCHRCVYKSKNRHFFYTRSGCLKADKWNKLSDRRIKHIKNEILKEIKRKAQRTNRNDTIA